MAEGAGKLAGREQGVQERDASCRRAHRFVPLVRQDAAAELCTRGAARSAEQSCAAQAAAADLQSRVESQDAAVRVLLAARPRQPPMVAQKSME